MIQYRIQHPGFYALTLFSLTILLILTGFFMATTYVAQRYTTQFQEEVKFVVELKTGTTEDQRIEVIEMLTSEPTVIAGSVEFVSREAALEEMRSEMSDDVVLAGMENPFTDMVRFGVEAGSFQEAGIEELKSKVEEHPSVFAMHHPAGMFDAVFGLLDQAQAVGAVIILVFILLCAILIHHIMRLNVLSQRKQIRTMQLVGGHPSFVRRPYLVLAVKMALTAWAAAGLISAAIAIFGAGVSGSDVSPLHVTLGSLILLILAVAVCIASTWVAVTRVLNQG